MEIITLDRKKELQKDLLSINDSAWPEFMLHWNCSAWSHLFSTFDNYQILIIEDNNIMAFGHTIPFYWDKNLNTIPNNLKILVERAVQNYKNGFKPNILLALAAVVSKDYLGRGLSFEIVKEMKNIALKNDLGKLIVPVRPTLKPKYPLISIDTYSNWKRHDGLPFDPWLRVHKKLGGVIFKTSDECMTITGNVKEWEKWTGLKMPSSGKFIVEGALNPVNIDIDSNIGKYSDPCIWIKYQVK